MSYPNAYLRDFVPVLGQILKEKQIAPEKLHLEIIDEESEEKSIFEPVGVDEVLDQLADELNHLTVYTDRPAHFQAFAEQIYEENGLMPLIFTKKQLKSRSFSGAQGVADRADMRPGVGDTLVLDFEWEGQCYFNLLAQGKNYIPIHKKPWKIAENLARNTDRPSDRIRVLNPDSESANKDKDIHSTVRSCIKTDRGKKL